MAKKKNSKKNHPSDFTAAAEIVNQPITETIEKNFMPYAMSVIVSRAIPAIDGFKPSHRKLLYTMYKMGLLNGARTKSANVVGQTMKLNPHGDQAIYATLVRLTRGNEALLHPFIDSKGTFGKHYSSDIDYAAPRYTECKLDKLCNEIFSGIDKDAVDFCENYDNTMLEPTMLPTAFPNVLVSPNIGVAVGMACSICSFNLSEICEGTIQLLKNPNTDTERLIDIIRAPDFPSGGNLIYDRQKYKELFETGKGSVKIRARYSFDKESNCIDVHQIPYSTTIEAIIKKIVQYIKEGKLKEITDVRDEIDLNGFKLTIDLRRGTNPDKLMSKLYKMTPLEDSFECNFNVLIDGAPQILGVKEIIGEWIKFRINSVRRQLTFDLNKKKDKLHLLLGLGKILLDIDKAIKIVRETALEKDVVFNLMEGFGIDQIQAEYIAEIKLRNLNREYIINKIKEIENLQKEIAELELTIGSEIRIKNVIIAELKEIKKEYSKPRLTQLIDSTEISEYNEEENIENFNVKLVFTKEGYFKKITLLSYRGNDEQKLKEGDRVTVCEEASNLDELLFFTDKGQVYKSKVSDFDTVKASQLGEYIPAKLGFDEGEHVLAMKSVKDYSSSGYVLIFFDNGKGVKISLLNYETKTNRKKLTNAFSAANTPVGFVFANDEEKDILLVTNNKKSVIVSSSLIPEKATRTSQGVTALTLKKGDFLTLVDDTFNNYIVDAKKYKKNKIPCLGVTLADSDKNNLPN